MKNIDSYINNLAQITADKKLPWSQENLTTFYTELSTKKGDLAVISIQKVRGEEYILQVKNMTKNELIIIVDTDSGEYAFDFPVRDALKNLFNTIANVLEREKLDFLDDILSDFV